MVRRTEALGAGDLRARVRLEARAETDDGYGNLVGAWTAQFERAAYIGPLKGGESVLAARLQGTQPAVIVLRYDSQTVTITPDWRAVELRPDGSEIAYAIRGAEDMERRRKWWTLLVEAGVAT